MLLVHHLAQVSEKHKDPALLQQQQCNLRLCSICLYGLVSLFWNSLADLCLVLCDIFQQYLQQ